MKRVDVYTVRYCPYCAAAKTVLKRNGIAFTEIDIAANWERRDEMIERANGLNTVPQIFIGATHVGDVQQLQTLEQEGKLAGLLSDPP